MARRLFKPTEAEQREDEDTERRLRQEAHDARQDDAIRQGGVADGGLYR
ncbi:hypothetical protein HerbRD11066_18800 [Herbidospora sp. RD11066]